MPDKSKLEVPPNLKQGYYEKPKPDVSQFSTDFTRHRPIDGTIDQRSDIDEKVNTPELPRDFDPDYYLLVNQDVAAAGQDPAMHYLLYGRAEGRAYRNITSNQPTPETQIIRKDYLLAQEIINSMHSAARKIATALRTRLALFSIFTLSHIFKSQNPHEITLIKTNTADGRFRELAGSDFYLDRETINTYFSAQRRPMGSIQVSRAYMVSQYAAWRIAKRLGSRLASSSTVSARAAAQAWLFTIWTEMCTIVPLRHLARDIARAAGNKTIFVPIEKLTFSCLNYWYANEVEPIYLAVLLRHFGAKVCLVLQNQDASANEMPCHLEHLRFVPHGGYLSTPVSALPDASLPKRTALVASGIRNIRELRSRNKEALTIQADWSMEIFSADCGLYTRDELRANCIVVALEPIYSAFHSENISIYRAIFPNSSIQDLFYSMMEGPTIRAAERADFLAKLYSIETVHVCEHAFFENSLFAEAVRKVGGSVIAWPHSANAANVFIREANDFSVVNCITQKAADDWTLHLPSQQIRIDSSIMLEPCDNPRVFSEHDPITIVVVAVGFNLVRLPLLDYTTHANSYKRFFSKLQNLRPGVRIIFKPREMSETHSWLCELLGESGYFDVTPDGPRHIEHPNMIFVCISFASTALLEGIARGIPCMIVRETEVLDYAYVDSSVVPTGSADYVIDTILKCANEAGYNSLVARQQQWYARQVRFSS